MARPWYRNRATIVAGVGIVLIATGGLFWPRQLFLLRTARQMRQDLHEKVQKWIADGELARKDGYVYAVDVGQLMIYAAKRADRELYTSFRDFTVMHLVIDNPDDPYTKGFVPGGVRMAFRPMLRVRPKRCVSPRACGWAMKFLISRQTPNSP